MPLTERIDAFNKCCPATKLSSVYVYTMGTLNTLNIGASGILLELYQDEFIPPLIAIWVAENAETEFPTKLSILEQVKKSIAVNKSR